MALEPNDVWNDALTNKDENVEIACEETGGGEVAFDENAESCRGSARIQI